MLSFSPLDFIRESNRIEGIERQPTTDELLEHQRFMALKEITIKELQKFVKVYQPNARLRDKVGMNVRVGSYYPPKGGPLVREQLEIILAYPDYFDPESKMPRSEAAYYVHHQYESLHPFTDGNGRSGRMLWIWMMRNAPLGFLHSFYYQSLQFSRK